MDSVTSTPPSDSIGVWFADTSFKFSTIGDGLSRRNLANASEIHDVAAPVSTRAYAFLKLALRGKK